MKHTESKEARGLVTQFIVYASRKYPHAQNQELKVDLRRGTIIDLDYAAALVAVRTSLSFHGGQPKGRQRDDEEDDRDGCACGSDVDVPSRGWIDVAHIRAHGRRWLATHNERKLNSVSSSCGTRR
ncbi:MAG: hypothetical protein ACRDTT_21380 [Pseudonocardiaceae bacterium]